MRIRKARSDQQGEWVNSGDEVRENQKNVVSGSQGKKRVSRVRDEQLGQKLLIEMLRTGLWFQHMDIIGDFEQFRAEERGKCQNRSSKENGGKRSGKQ